MQRCSPATPAYVGQRRGSLLSLPLRQYPGASASDVRDEPGRLQLVPGCGHGEHTARLSVPRSAKKLWSHTQSAKLVELFSSVVECAGQGAHAPMLEAPFVLDQVPLPQGMATPALHHLPGGQSLHSSALRRRFELPTLPASHGVGEELPLPHHDASSHSMHVVAPGLYW